MARCSRAEQTVERELADSPVVWFAVLMRARLARDVDMEERAASELRRLGVQVDFRGEQHVGAA